MKANNIPPPGNKNENPGGPEDKSRIPEKETRKKAESEPEKTGDDGSPSREEVVSTWSNPVTNQDEQEKITNTGGNDIPAQEK